MNDTCYLPPVRIQRRMSIAQASQEVHGWHLRNYAVADRWDELAEIVSGGGAPLWGIIDTGIDPMALDISQGTIDEGGIRETRDFSGSRHGWKDAMGHGSHVAGIMAAISGNGFGVAGVFPRLPLAIAKALGDNGTGSISAIVDAIRWLVDLGCSGINLSLGSDYPDPALEAAVKYAYDNDCVLFAAAGNSAGEVNYPAKYPGVIPVTAFDQNENLAEFSCRGPEVITSAPGVDILSTYQNGGYAELSGTSMACPYAASRVAVAQALGQIDDWTFDNVVAFIKSNSRDLGIPGDDTHFGAGLFTPPEQPDEVPSSLWQLGNLKVFTPAQKGNRVGLDW